MSVEAALVGCPRVVRIWRFCMPASPWAILRCQFADTVNVPTSADDAYFADLFTGSGQGSLNMVDYFLDSSHGAVDISGTDVLGWYVLDQDRANYTGSGANPAGRDQLIAWAKQKAIAADGIDFSRYAGVLVCMNVPTDLFGVPHYAAVCDVDGLYPNDLALVMGYEYGMAASWMEGASGPWTDPWDAMSSGNAYMFAHDRWGLTGPGLNAANMYGRGWLDATRTHVMNATGTALIHLRPLHRRDLPGTLAARIGDFFVEFRVQAGFDAGLPHAAVLVHTLVNNRSYLMVNSDNTVALVKGSVFDHQSSSGHVVFTVEELDPDGETATIRVNYQLPTKSESAGPGFEVLGAASAGGAGVIFVNGKLQKVPPHSPAYRVLEHLAVVADAETVDLAEARDVMRREGYKAIGATVADVLQDLEGFKEVAPRQMH
ncbi:hypothetical protein ACFPFX_25875 [Streptomyces mauvecolor]|uniref:Peptidase C39-like domain-containing protein n=1 Tax=Streptomyces mauvecolor TaxID=58345 RepID=A0ABV9UTL2_9ACTN